MLNRTDEQRWLDQFQRKFTPNLDVLQQFYWSDQQRLMPVKCGVIKAGCVTDALMTTPSGVAEKQPETLSSRAAP